MRIGFWTTIHISKAEGIWMILEDWGELPSQTRTAKTYDDSSFLLLMVQKSCTSCSWYFIPFFLHPRWCRISEPSTVSPRNYEVVWVWIGCLTFVRGSLAIAEALQDGETLGGSKKENRRLVPYPMLGCPKKFGSMVCKWVITHFWRAYIEAITRLLILY